jgi:hypothetical protein
MPSRQTFDSPFLLNKIGPSHELPNDHHLLGRFSRLAERRCQGWNKLGPINVVNVKALLHHRLLVPQHLVQGFHGKLPAFWESLPGYALTFILLNACGEGLAKGVGFWGGIDAGSADALCDIIGCKFCFSIGGRLLGAAVRIENLFASFNVARGQENHGKGGELECMRNIGEATENELSIRSSKK